MSPNPRLAVVLALALLCRAAAKEKPKDTLSSEAIAQGLQDLGKTDFATRRSAARKLFSSGMGAVPSLVEALRKAEASRPVRMPALQALREAYAGAPRAAELRHLLSRITGHSARSSAGWSAWLDKHQGETREQLVGADLKRLSELLKSKEVPDKRAALEIIARVGDETHMKEAQPYLAEKDPFVRRVACRAVAETCQAKGAAALKALFATKEIPVRQEALAAAAIAGLPATKIPLMAALADRKSPIERARAVLGLARLGEAAALAEAAEGLALRAEQDFQLIYCEALSCFPEDKAAEALKKALADPKCDFPIMPAAALAAMGERIPEILKPIEEVLKSPLPAPNPKDIEPRVRARQDKLFAARAVADVLSDQAPLRSLADEAFKGLTTDVNAAIDRGVKALQALQEKKRRGPLGSWPFNTNGWALVSFQNGATPLALLALRKAGVPKDDPDFVLGLRYVIDTLDQPPKDWQTVVYTQAMSAILLSELDPYAYRDRVRKIVEWLQAGQLAAKVDPAREGQWNYPANQTPNQCSNSVTHFALLGLCFSSQNVKGIDLPKDLWRTSLGFFTRAQRLNGGWGYDKVMNQGDSYGTMTVVGVTSLLICQSGLMEKDFQEFDVRESPPIQDALNWLEDRFDDEKVPAIESSGIVQRSLTFKNFERKAYKTFYTFTLADLEATLRAGGVA